VGSLTLPATGLLYLDANPIIYTVEKHPVYGGARTSVAGGAGAIHRSRQQRAGADGDAGRAAQAG
jgi:hypothetical protein